MKYICKYCLTQYEAPSECLKCEEECENAIEEMLKSGVKDWD